MIPIPRLATAACTLALVLQAGCAGQTMRPAVTGVDLALSATPSEGTPSLPVVAELRVRNTGTTRVWHCMGCGCGNGIAFTVLGPDGGKVWLRDPREPPPLCPDWLAPLEPGQDVSSGFVFTGTLYVADHPEFPTPTYAAPPGVYTVIACFSYAAEISGEWVPLERRTTFAWQP